jgi:esterase
MASPHATLHHELIAEAGPPPGQWLLLTHGIFGAGGNWRSIARKITRARPQLGCVLVDLRNHGRSEAPPSPHDLASCADDVGAQVDQLAAEGVQITAAAGHSFGGKVIAMLRHRRGEHAHVEQIQQWWMLDSSPSARPDADREPGNQVRDVLVTLESLPPRFASRAAFEETLLAAGLSRPLAQWMALNLESDDETKEYRLRLPLPAVREMLQSYYVTDLWDSLRDPAGGDVHVVVATRSNTLTEEDRATLQAGPPHLHMHPIDAGHWLHIEAADAVIELLSGAER